MIETDEQARAYTRAMRADSSAWCDRGMDPSPVEVGEEFNLPECIPPHWPLRTPERYCPRVELWPENDLAARLVFAALPEHTRPLLARYIEALTADVDEESANRAVAHALSVLQSATVTDWMRAQFEKGRDS